MYWLSPWLSRQWFSVFILFLGIIGTFIFTLSTIRIAQTKEEARFESTVIRNQRTMENRLGTYIALLRAASGLMVASSSVTKAEFQTFADQLELRQQYPGIQGIGYALHIPAQLKTAMLAEITASNPRFTFYPDSQRDVYTSIVFLEPLDERNQAAVGYDMFSEPVRRAAMINARDSGQLALSGKVTLVQEIDSTKQAGFLLYLPIYHGNVTPLTIEERRQKLRGYIYAPFRAGDFFHSIQSSETATGIDFAVYDSEETTSDHLLYRSDEEPVSRFPKSFPLYTNRSQLTVADRTWTILYTTSPAFNHAVERDIYPLYLATGLILSFFLFVLSRIHYQTVAKVQQATADLLISQAALTQSRIQYKTVAENASDLVSIVDTKGMLLYTSPSSEDILGYSADELAAHPSFLSYIHPEDVPLVKTEMLSAENEMTSRCVYRKRRKDGSYVTLEGISTALLTEGTPENELSGFLIISRDITEREAMEKRKDEFISIASHELKTPVTSLKVYTKYLQQYFSNKNDPVSVDLLRKMDHQLSKLTNLIRDLLDVSRIESGRLQIRPGSFELKDLIEESAEELQRTTKRQQIKLQELWPVQVRGDRNRISQVIVNLLGNAIKYAPDSSQILVSQKKQKNNVIISIQDFGPGIPRSKQKKVFERFFRLEGPGQETFSGFGLGLYIASEIVRLHKGQIWVESEEGQGSIFCFSLPLDGTISEDGQENSHR
jgi:PAS domain S-box-containing protein